MPKRIWIDGCFDFFHHGHANVLYQSKTVLLPQDSAPPTLLIGVHSDESITVNKGPPVMNLKERLITVEANKWCDEIIPDAPYVTQLKLVSEDYRCDFVIHGDDITTDKDGNDCYDEVRKNGMLKLVRRTEGVSTTELIDRLLNDRFVEKSTGPIEEFFKKNSTLIRNFATGFNGVDPFNNIWYVDSHNSLVEYQTVNGFDLNNSIYLYGGFDLFNPFHIKVLESFQHQPVVLGILKDDNDFIMNLLQRLLCVLQCKYVHNVIVGVDHGFTIGLEQYDIESFDNDFSYLKHNGIKKRINNHLELYQERQLKKGFKAELESQLR